LRFTLKIVAPSVAIATIWRMFHGFVRYPDGGTTCLTSPAGLADAWAQSEAQIWLDFETPTPDELHAVLKVIDLDSGAIDDSLTGEQRPRLDEYSDHVFMVLYGLRGVEREPDEEITPRKFAAFLGQRYLITVSRQPLPSVRETRDRCNRSPGLLLAGTVDEVLYRIVDKIVDRYVEVTQEYEARIEALEERSLSDEIDRELLSEVTGLRRDLMDMRHLALSQRELLRPLANGDLEYISPALGQRFSHVTDHLMQVIEMTDALREQLAAVRDNYHTSIATQTNAVMQTLTIFATIMLPLTFVAGIYGMNLPLWPSPDSPGSFWAVMGVMAAITAGMLYFFRLNKWL